MDWMGLMFASIFRSRPSDWEAVFFCFFSTSFHSKPTINGVFLAKCQGRFFSPNRSWGVHPKHKSGTRWVLHIDIYIYIYTCKIKSAKDSPIYVAQLESLLNKGGLHCEAPWGWLQGALQSGSCKLQRDDSLEVYLSSMFGDHVISIHYLHMLDTYDRSILHIYI